MVLPLRPDGHPDAAGCNADPGCCRIRRFWAGEEDQHGRLEHRVGGVAGAHWVIDYDETTTADDQAPYRFDSHAFAPGEYVTVRDRLGAHTYRVVSVVPEGG